LWAGGGLALAAVLVLVGYLAWQGPTTANTGPVDADGKAKTAPAGDPAAGEDFVYPGLRGVTLSPKGDVLAAAVTYGTDDKAPGRVQFWNAATGEPLGPPLLASSTYVVQLAFSPNGERLAVGAKDGTVSVWDFKSRSRLRSYNKLQQHPGALEFSPDGKWLMAAWTAPNFNPHHGWVRLWDAQTLEEARSFPATTNRVGTDLHAATFSPDGKQLAVGTIQGEIRFWDPATGQQTAPPRFVPDGAWALRFDPESSRLVVGNAHGAVFHWEEEKLQLLNEATRDNIVLCLAFSPKGKWLAWGTIKGQVFVRNQETGEVRLALTCKGDVRNLTFTSDGNRLIAAGQQDARPPRVWDSEAGTEREGFQLPKGAVLP
jgi:WD40 repeat protein